MASELSILQNLRSSMIRREPFPYFVIENALPTDIYERLEVGYPSESFIFEHHRGKRAHESYQPNTRYDLPAAYVFGNRALDLGLWRAFTEYHTSQEFLDEVLSKLGDVIADTHPKLISRMQKKSPDGKPRAGVRHFSDLKGQCEVALDCQIGINSPPSEKLTSVRVAHLDNPIEIYAGLFYLRHPDDRSNGGDLEIYTWKNPKQKSIGPRRLISQNNVIVRDSVTYSPNRFAMFVNSIESIHGVTIRGVTGYPRRLVNIIAEAYPTMNKVFNDRPYREDRGRVESLKRKLFR